MKQLDVKVAQNRDFAVLHNGVEIGRQYYTKWHSNKAEITVGETHYTLEPKGFWQTTFQVMQGSTPVLKINYNWSGYAHIVPVKEPHHFYNIKPRGFFKHGFLLANYKGEAVLEISATFSFKTFKTTYTIQCQDNFGNTPLEQLLIIIAIHCYRQAQRNSAAAAS